ncbi:uncharacterized protein LOC143359063 [Halictus rubicundus]|uniref:uncharacterized protein LOC143359063 n=1 Tax=Halictus rubicundus TaxID=77578 RepID=UPI0040351C90
MPHHIRKDIIKNLKEKEVLEPESSFVDHLIRRPQSGRRIEKSNVGVEDLSRKSRKSKVNDLETQNLKLPQVPEEIVDLINILRHKNFLKVVDQYFRPGVNNQSQKKSQRKNSNATVEKSST